MKKFFLYVALLLGVLVVADRALAFVFDRFYARTRTGQTGGKINLYLTQPRQPELLIMGNSRALYQIIPDSFPVSTFNLCHAGMSQVFQTGLLDVISHEKRLPRVILLHLDPFDYTKPVDQVSDIQNLKYYFGRNATVTKYVGQISPFEPYKYWFDSYRYNGRVVSLLKNFVETVRTPADKLGDGYVPLPPTPRDSLKTIYSVQRDTNDVRLIFHEDRLHYLLEFVELCRANNIRLICFTSPIYPKLPYAEAAGRKLEAELRARSIPYVDYINEPIPALVNRPTLWLDSRHLNELGAKIESHDLARRVAPMLAAFPVPTGASVPPVAAARP